MNTKLTNIVNGYFQNTKHFQNLPNHLSKIHMEKFSILLFSIKIQILLIEIHHNVLSLDNSFIFFEAYHYSVCELQKYEDDINKQLKCTRNLANKQKNKILTLYV